jgi:hypothetical protein
LINRRWQVISLCHIRVLYRLEPRALT